MTTGASISTKERPSLPAKERGGPLRFPNVIRLSSHTNKGPPTGSPRDRHRPERRYTANAVLIRNVAQHRSAKSRL